jgi:hypothetical protein
MLQVAYALHHFQGCDTLQKLECGSETCEYMAPHNSLIVLKGMKMARKKVRKRKVDSPKEIDFKITPDVTKNTPPYNTNYIAVTHSRYDFTLTLIKLPTALRPEQEEILKKGQRLPIEAALQVVVPPQLIPGLIDALNGQKDKYEKRFGKIEKGK